VSWLTIAGRLASVALVTGLAVSVVQPVSASTLPIPTAENTTTLVPENSSNGYCSGTWYGTGIATAIINVVADSSGGNNVAMNWAFHLTKVTQEDLGSPVTVTMSNTGINKRAINPPYSSHTEVSDYNFHSSITRYSYIGTSTSHPLVPSDTAQLYWFIQSTQNPIVYRYVYLPCTVGSPS